MLGSDALFDSDPAHYIVSRNRDLIVEYGMHEFVRRTDFVDVLKRHVPGCIALLGDCPTIELPNSPDVVRVEAWELLSKRFRKYHSDRSVSDDGAMFETAMKFDREFVAAIVSKRDPGNKSTMVHRAFRRPETGLMKALLKVPGIGLGLKDGKGRVAVEYCTADRLVALLLRCCELPLMQDLIQSHTATFVNLARTRLEDKRDMFGIQILLNNDHFFQRNPHTIGIVIFIIFIVIRFTASSFL